MAFLTGIADVFKALRSRLTRQGVNIGGTAGFPRVEIHSLVEDTPQDKDGSVRSVTCSIECISTEKVADVVALTESNLDLIFGHGGLGLTGHWSVIGIVPGQTRMFSEQETLDSQQIIYRMITDVTIWFEKINYQNQ